MPYVAYALKPHCINSHHLVLNQAPHGVAMLPYCLRRCCHISFSAPDGSSRLKRNFEFLGGAIGDDAFVEAHTRARVEAVGPLLDALAELGDAQVGLRLLRSCAGYGRLVHSMRCNPPHSQRAALQLFDGKVQAAFSSITGLHLTATQRAQVGRGLGFAGVGVRCSSLDAPAAFLASVGSCAVACEEADPAYVAAAVVLDPACTQATTALNAHLQHPLAPGAALSLKQKALTRLLDEASWQAQLAASSTTRQALLRSEAEPGARAFLVAKPGGVTRMETALFVTELRHRLGIPEASEDCWCPQCYGILDAHSLHASTCVAGGEKTLRHTAVRDALCKWAERAGLQPEKERPGLLLPQRPEDVGTQNRRPADIFLPSLHGSPAALDLAITAPQRQDVVVQGATSALAAASAYAASKAAYLNTAQLCSQQGVNFVPLVAESTGAWDRVAGQLLLQIACSAAARTGDDSAALHSDLLQELSVLIRSHRARAVLRRRAELAG
jgi:hypothetical protein